MDDSMSVSDAVRAALFGQGVPNVSPELAGIKEGFRQEVGCL